MTEQTIRYKGRPVPYITKWSDEDIPDQPFRIGLKLTNAGTVTYLSRNDGTLDRDQRGVLWFMDANGHGGEPMWKSVHTSRHRRSMTKPLCQVCGTLLPREGTPWLFSGREWALFEPDDDEWVTITPPTCEDCWPVAIKLCPHLYRTGAHRVHVSSWSLWGVYGDLYRPDRSCKRGALVPFTNTAGIDMTCAKQMAIKLDKMEEVS